MSNEVGEHGVRGFFKGIRSEVNSWIDSVKELYQICIKFLRDDIWTVDFETLKGPRKLVANGLLRVLELVHNSRDNKLGLYSISLTFFTTFAIIPFLALIFFIVDGVGLENYFESVIYRTFEGNEQIIEMALGFANNIISTGKESAFGMVSAFVFFWSVVWLIFNIERHFNAIWRISKRRSMGKRVAYCTGFILVSPFLLLLFLSLGVFTTNSIGQYSVKMLGGVHIAGAVQWLLYYLICVVCLTMMNKYIPNTKVEWRHAFRASIVAAFAFVLLQFLYTGTQVMVSRLNRIYGAVAAFPLFLIWLNLSWMMILIGAEMTHSFQSLKAHIDRKKKEKEERLRIKA